MNIDTFQISRVVGLSNDIRLEEELAVLNYHVDTILFDPSRHAFKETVAVLDHWVDSAFNQCDFGLIGEDVQAPKAEYHRDDPGGM